MFVIFEMYLYVVHVLCITYAYTSSCVGMLVQLDEELIVPQRIGGVHRGRPMSDAEGYQPIDFSSLPIGPDFDLVNGMFLPRHAICMLLWAWRPYARPPVTLMNSDHIVQQKNESGHTIECTQTNWIEIVSRDPQFCRVWNTFQTNMGYGKSVLHSNGKSHTANRMLLSAGAYNNR